MSTTNMNQDKLADALCADVSGEFVSIDNERYYAIHNVDNMPAFFISLVSDSDHWMFVSSYGGLTAGRVSPETALFPYVPVDQIHQSHLHTGSKTLIRVAGDQPLWEPFNGEHLGRFRVTRNLYKNVLGNKLCFEEINHDLDLAYRYTWKTSAEFGFVRDSKLINLSDSPVDVTILDGLQNVLPAGTPRHTQTISSNLVDAYKFTELSGTCNLALFSLYSGITDRAEPCESLKANTLFCLGLDQAQVILDATQVDSFKRRQPLQVREYTRGVRGAYLVQSELHLDARQSKQWQLVANLELSQTKVSELQHKLSNQADLSDSIKQDVEKGSDSLARIMASADGMQCTAQENVAVHHYANVLFNVLRGGIFENQYHLCSRDFVETIQVFNAAVYARHQEALKSLPERIEFSALVDFIEAQSDPQLTRLSLEYLPITFGRRHGDPSRPWNQFAIQLKDEDGQRLLSYQGNWRDIFQNWEALTFSYPEFVESVIAKFVNASTMDGYNPYRITKQGIDWEVEDPEDPWSYIGYWGDHQIIYLLKMLELSKRFHPQKLSGLLRQSVFSYANVPYRIKSFEAMLKDAKNTVDYDEALASIIEQRVSQLGSDGKLVLDNSQQVYQVNLFEKLMVPLLCKLGNLVVDGGIWLNAQRPEWNDANNALVGQGLSMVTLYYMRRYISFMQDLLAQENGEFEISTEVATWLESTANILAEMVPKLSGTMVSEAMRFEFLSKLGKASCDYRSAVYSQTGMSGKTAVALDRVLTMLNDAQTAIDHSIAANQSDDGLYHAYNLLGLKDNNAHVDYLYPMLEGQVALLSSGAIAPEKAAQVVESLFDSAVYRDDQNTFMLYPDRAQTRFMDKNRVDDSAVQAISLLSEMVANDDRAILLKDADGQYRFNAEIRNAGDLQQRLSQAVKRYHHSEQVQQSVLELYESVFNHKAFTGRSGGMFGFEGLGCIYWHMVAKLLLAVGENFYQAIGDQADKSTIDRLGKLYYKVRKGIGFNKTPSEYGAFPTDPYSHTPGHAGAQQPGMTGQVKEEVLCRFAELGVHVEHGQVTFAPRLLRPEEFLTSTTRFKYLDVNNQWQSADIETGSLAFSWCQVPVIYTLDDSRALGITLTYKDGSSAQLDSLTLSEKDSSAIFQRNSDVARIDVVLNSQELFIAAN